MTVKSKRIKTKLMTKGQSIAAAGDEQYLGADSWVVQEDITIIGLGLRVSVQDGAFGWDSGRVSALGEISRVAKMFADGVLMGFCKHVICREATVGANSTQTVLGGQPTEVQFIMFPEGYGVDMDDGEVLYLNTDLHNDMANAHHTSINGIVYYVER